MGLDLGESRSKRIAVSNVTMRFNVSEKILFANFITSHKTGRTILKDGVSIPERKYRTWMGRFVGNALEAAKGLADKQYIDIVNGWLDWDDYDNSIYICVSDFVLSSSLAEDDDSTQNNSEPPSADAVSNGEFNTLRRTVTL